MRCWVTTRRNDTDGDGAACSSMSDEGRSPLLGTRVAGPPPRPATFTKPQHVFPSSSVTPTALSFKNPTGVHRSARCGLPENSSIQRRSGVYCLTKQDEDDPTVMYMPHRWKHIQYMECIPSQDGTCRIPGASLFTSYHRQTSKILILISARGSIHARHWSENSRTNVSGRSTESEKRPRLPTLLSTRWGAEEQADTGRDIILLLHTCYPLTNQGRRPLKRTHQLALLWHLVAVHAPAATAIATTAGGSWSILR
jgi:hypothetical protein